MKTIYLAGGCFWGVQEYFSRIEGVLETEVGYANGKTENPTYEEVCRMGTGHAETVKVVYDEKVLSLETVLERLFRIIDPTVKNRQGPDVGAQYRTGIYTVEEEDLKTARAFVEKAAPAYDRPVVTEVRPLENYYPAEAYHQDYLKKNPGGYCHIDLNA